MNSILRFVHDDQGADLIEYALLAGLIRSPNGLAPRRYPRAALVRRNRVLEGMAEEGLLDAAASAAATREPLRLAPPRVRSVAALYVAAEVAHLLPELLPPRFAQAFPPAKISLLQWRAP